MRFSCKKEWFVERGGVLLSKRGVFILQKLKNLVHNRSSRKEINIFIEECFKISLSYIKLNRRKIHKFVGNDDDLEDTAIDAIVPLFFKNEDGDFINFKNAFDSWNPPIKTDEEALYFLNKIIARSVEQHISLLIKEADPFFAKILRSINYLVKKEDFKKLNHLGSLFIVEKDTESCLTADRFISGNIIDDKSFEKIPLNLLLDNNLLANIFEYLKEHTEFFPAIPINFLVYRLKNLNLSTLDQLEKKADFFLRIEIDETINIGLKEISEKLDGYFQKGKLNNEEVDCLNQTFFDIADDLKSGGLNRGLYDYLHKNMLNLSNEDYHKKYQRILEYLLKVMKNTISQNL